MSLIDTLNGIWTAILVVTSHFVMPDWGWLISILPVLIFSFAAQRHLVAGLSSGAVKG